MDGYNATIFTYGQTGSGKTHSILGNDADPGFIPRCVEDVFSYKQEHEDTLVFTLRVSYLEVYNEEINDLLTPGEEGQNLKIIAEDPQKGAIIENLVEEVVSEKRDILAVIARGESQRSYGATNMNATSSRSHTLFRLVIESQEILHPINAAHFEDDANPNAFTKLSKETSSTKGAVKVSKSESGNRERQPRVATESGNRERQLRAATESCVIMTLFTLCASFAYTVCAPL